MLHLTASRVCFSSVTSCVLCKCASLRRLSPRSYTNMEKPPWELELERTDRKRHRQNISAMALHASQAYEESSSSSRLSKRKWQKKKPAPGLTEGDVQSQVTGWSRFQDTPPAPGQVVLCVRCGKAPVFDTSLDLWYCAPCLAPYHAESPGISVSCHQPTTVATLPAEVSKLAADGGNVSGEAIVARDQEARDSSCSGGPVG